MKNFLITCLACILLLGCADTGAYDLPAKPRFSYKLVTNYPIYIYLITDNSTNTEYLTQSNGGFIKLEKKKAERE